MKYTPTYWFLDMLAIVVGVLIAELLLRWIPDLSQFAITKSGILMQDSARDGEQ